MTRIDLIVSEYEKAERLIDGLSQTIAGSEKWEPLAESAKAEFDMILQGVLLYAAAADSILSEKEMSFVNELRVHGDLMDLLNQNMRGRHPDWKDLKYEDLTNLPADLREELRNVLPFLISASTQAFLSKFAKLDYMIESTDLLGKIKDIILNIATAFATIDAEKGNADSAEVALGRVDATQQAFTHIFEINWAAYDPQRLAKNEVKMKNAKPDGFV